MLAQVCVTICSSELQAFHFSWKLWLSFNIFNFACFFSEYKLPQLVTNIRFESPFNEGLIRFPLLCVWREEQSYLYWASNIFIEVKFLSPPGNVWGIILIFCSQRNFSSEEEVIFLKQMKTKSPILLTTDKLWIIVVANDLDSRLIWLTSASSFHCGCQNYFCQNNLTPCSAEMDHGSQCWWRVCCLLSSCDKQSTSNWSWSPCLWSSTPQQIVSTDSQETRGRTHNLTRAHCCHWLGSNGLNSVLCTFSLQHWL